jgi:xanthine dehydrogenase molybdopterin-binding subunit B
VLQSATAFARWESDGRLTVELAMTDIGAGTYTILTQIAAETMDLPVDRVTSGLATPAIRPLPARAAPLGPEHPVRRSSPLAENSGSPAEFVGD